MRKDIVLMFVTSYGIKPTGYHQSQAPSVVRPGHAVGLVARRALVPSKWKSFVPRLVESTLSQQFSNSKASAQPTKTSGCAMLYKCRTCRMSRLVDSRSRRSPAELAGPNYWQDDGEDALVPDGPRHRRRRRRTLEDGVPQLARLASRPTPSPGSPSRPSPRTTGAR